MPVNILPSPVNEGVKCLVDQHLTKSFDLEELKTSSDQDSLITTAEQLTSPMEITKDTNEKCYDSEHTGIKLLNLAEQNTTKNPKDFVEIVDNLETKDEDPKKHLAESAQVEFPAEDNGLVSYCLLLIICKSQILTLIRNYLSLFVMGQCLY